MTCRVFSASQSYMTILLFLSSNNNKVCAQMWSIDRDNLSFELLSVEHHAEENEKRRNDRIFSPIKHICVCAICNALIRMINFFYYYLFSISQHVFILFISLFLSCFIFAAIHTAGRHRANGIRFNRLRSTYVLPKLFGLLRCHKRKPLPTYNGNYYYHHYYYYSFTNEIFLITKFIINI